MIGYPNFEELIYDMAQPSHRPEPVFDQARNELFSHILRCGVIEATVDHQKDWFDDTMDYLTDRYAGLSNNELDGLRELGERYCRPVINHRSGDESDESPADGTEAENEAVGAVS